jgi:hypothetical protein
VSHRRSAGDVFLDLGIAMITCQKRKLSPTPKKFQI